MNDFNKTIPTKRKICAVFVTYHPDNDFPKRLDKILAQVDRIVIVDNGSNQKARLVLRKLADIDNVAIIQKIKNGRDPRTRKHLYPGKDWETNDPGETRPFIQTR